MPTYNTSSDGHITQKPQTSPPGNDPKEAPTPLKHSAPKQDDIRPLAAIPPDGETEHEGWSGWIPADKFSDQGSTPHE
jgi:hypothetical protein